MTNPQIARPVSAVHPVVRRQPEQPALSIGLSHPHSTGRQYLESCIARRFDQKYCARIDHFLPYLLSLEDAEQLGAVTGLQPAAQGTLFLEQYLDSVVEQAISQAFQTPVERNQVIEIGNLAAVVPGAVYILFAVLASVLHEAGFRWVVCTATPQVESMLNGMQFPSRHICSADPARLKKEAGDWGEYYATRPRVIAGEVGVAVRQLAADPHLSALIEKLKAPISRIAASLKTSQ